MAEPKWQENLPNRCRKQLKSQIQIARFVIRTSVQIADFLLNKSVNWTFRRRDALSQIASDLRFAMLITNRNRNPITRLGAFSPWVSGSWVQDDGPWWGRVGWALGRGVDSKLCQKTSPQTKHIKNPPTTQKKKTHRELETAVLRTKGGHGITSQDSAVHKGEYQQETTPFRVSMVSWPAPFLSTVLISALVPVGGGLKLIPLWRARYVKNTGLPWSEDADLSTPKSRERQTSAFAAAIVYRAPKIAIL